MGNPNHDEQTGQFTSGASASDAAAAKGDHLGAQPADKSLRRVPGHGLIERSAPTAMHAHTPSVGTGGGGSGGGSGGSMRGGKMKLKGGMKTTTGLRQAAQERVAIGEDTDARHLPLSGGAQAQQLASRRLRNIPAGR